MKKILLLVALILEIASCADHKQNYIISGKVTDFNGHPLDSVAIRLKNRAFENLYETVSDSNGNYTMEVAQGDYYCLYAIKLSEYRVNKLEYWAWNIPVHQDLVINPQYDRMEIYAVNVFEPQVTPQETYMIYFRPMSLSKTLQEASRLQVDKQDLRKAGQVEKLLNKESLLYNFAPDTITANELTVEINGVRAKILGIDKITESARGISVYGYVVQVLKPTEGDQPGMEYDRVSVTLCSSETGESGKSEAFVKKI